MTNDAFVAFFAGMLSGLVLGIAVAAILAAVANNIERTDNEHR